MELFDPKINIPHTPANSEMSEFIAKKEKTYSVPPEIYQDSTASEDSRLSPVSASVAWSLFKDLSAVDGVIDEWVGQLAW